MRLQAWLPVLIIIFLYAIATLIAVVTRKQKIQQLQQYWNIEIGMSEEEMLQLMGNGYNRSLLKNNRIKYEWRINAISSGYSHKGYSTRHYSGVKKVTIYVRSGSVEEIRSHNV